MYTNRDNRKELNPEIKNQLIRNHVTKNITDQIILPSTLIDGRKNNWISTIMKDEFLIIGKLISRKKEMINNNELKVKHFNCEKAENNFLEIRECKNKLCKFGKWNEVKNECHMNIKKKDMLRVV